MTIPVHLVPVDDLLASLTCIASLADGARYKIDHGEATDGRRALQQIKDEALDAIARAEAVA